MNVFEPFFLVCFVVAVFVLFWAATMAVSGKGVQAVAALHKLGICAAIYMGVVLVVALASSRKTYGIGDTQCFDDWCIEVTNATRDGNAVNVTLKLSSRAKRVPQGEKGTVVYLIDSRGRRYDPAPDAVTVPLDTKLQPGESVAAGRLFYVSQDAADLGLIYTHEGGFPIGFFIIGENELFHGPAVVKLNRDYGL